MEPMIPGTGGHDFSPRTGSAPGFVRQMLARLQESEWCLVELMVAAGVWTAPLPCATDGERCQRARRRMGHRAVPAEPHAPDRRRDPPPGCWRRRSRPCWSSSASSCPPSLLPPSQYAILDSEQGSSHPATAACWAPVPTSSTTSVGSAPSSISSAASSKGGSSMMENCLSRSRPARRSWPRRGRGASRWPWSATGAPASRPPAR